jgi:hypothetical protein
MDKSRQQQVFDWLLEHRDALESSDNSSLYRTFRNSGLSRNRLRSYKSRLRDKVNRGEVDMPPQEAHHCPINHWWFSIGGVVLACIMGVLTILMLKRAVGWLSTLLLPDESEETEIE